MMRLALLLLLFHCANDAHVVPAKLAGVMPIFEVRVNGRDEPLWFLIDTGASYTFLDAKVVERLRLTPRDAGTVRGAGGVEVPVKAVDGVAFAIGDTKTTLDNVRITDLSGLQPLFDHRIDGFFGYDFLARWVVTIDGPNRRIVLTEPSKFEHDGRGAILPLRFGGRTNRWIYAPATIKYPGLPPEESEFFIDSGSLDEVNHPSLRDSKGPLREIRTGTGLGGVGSGRGVAGRTEWLRLGLYEIRDSESNCCPPLEGTERMIGQGVLSRFAVTYDYARKRMIVSRG